MMDASSDCRAYDAMAHYCTFSAAKITIDLVKRLLMILQDAGTTSVGFRMQLIHIFSRRHPELFMEITGKIGLQGISHHAGYFIHPVIFAGQQFGCFFNRVIWISSRGVRLDSALIFR